jgi:hypothetical protein
MKGLDWVIAPLALIAFAASLAVIAIWVPLPDLIVVCTIAVAMVAYDFFRIARGQGYRRNRNGAPK